MTDELAKHLHYLEDSTRLALFEAAIRSAIRPGGVVLDLGCGTGILGLLACRAGAARVYAVDRGGILEVAKLAAAANGVADRIRHIRGESTAVLLPEPVDLAICDQLGPLGFEAGITSAMSDAVTRFLKPGGRVIPEAFAVSLVPVESADTYRHVAGWDDAFAGFDLSAGRLKAAHRPRHLSHDARRLAEPCPCLAFDPRSAAAVVGSASWSLTAGGVCHGLAGWFDAQLAPGVLMTNDPSNPSAVKRPAGFLPLRTPVEVLPSDVITARLSVRDRVVAWAVDVRRGDDLLRATTQSSMEGWLLSPADLAPSS